MESDAGFVHEPGAEQVIVRHDAVVVAVVVDAALLDAATLVGHLHRDAWHRTVRSRQRVSRVQMEIAHPKAPEDVVGAG